MEKELLNYKYVGLSQGEAQKRIEKYGLNEINAKKSKKPVEIFINQFKDILVIILSIATAISFLLGEIVDAIVIFAVIILNGIFGFIQEFRAEKALEHLQEYVSYKAKVFRDGKLIEVDTKYLTVGDLIVLEAGDRVPADCEIISSKNLLVDESILTGESIPVSKSIFVDKNLYLGTFITSGKAVCKVCAIGLNTKMGDIAKLLSDIKEERTPLQERITQLGKTLAVICILVCLFIVVLGILRKENIYNMFMIGISLAVAAIPEGLPAAISISLAVGVLKMVRRNALIRKLASVETLGCVDIICTDKTGTLTENKMTVKKIETINNSFDVEGNGYEIKGRILEKGKIVKNALLDNIIICCRLCNNATLDISKKDLFGEVKVNTKGDPTEIALLILVQKYGESFSEYTRIDEIPFDSERKYMAVFVRKNGENISFVKGAVDILMNKCTYYMDIEGDIKKITVEDKKRIINKNNLLCENGMRVLGLFMKYNSFDTNDLIFLGLVGMIDPPKKGVKLAIDRAKKANIKTIMITGDHRLTAMSIAKDLNIVSSDNQIIEGDELLKVDDKDIDKYSVFARVSPKHKLQIVRKLKKAGHIVAMTGDGVNDAPALKESDIGISMGISGTDVTKQASSMILLNDNYSTIISAIEEGRIIYSNIRKLIRYLLACNIGEVLTMFIASCFNLPIPLLPIQILWVNLVTDGLPAACISLTRPDEDLMKRPPRKRNESIFAHGLFRKILIRGLLIGCMTILAFYITYTTVGDISLSRTTAFATLVISQLIYAFECTADNKGIFEINIFKNIYLLFGVLISLLIFLAVVYIPSLGILFEMSQIKAMDWVIIITCSTTPSFFYYLIEKNI